MHIKWVEYRCFSVTYIYRPNPVLQRSKLRFLYSYRVIILSISLKITESSLRLVRNIYQCAYCCSSKMTFSHCSVVTQIERFSIDCRKTKTKVITVNARISARGAYLIFGGERGALIRSGALIGSWALIRAFTYSLCIYQIFVVSQDSVTYFGGYLHITLQWKRQVLLEMDVP